MHSTLTFLLFFDQQFFKVNITRSYFIIGHLIKYIFWMFESIFQQNQAYLFKFPEHPFQLKMKLWKISYL